NVMFAMDRQREAATVAALSCVLNTVLNLAWIPSGGGVGSAAASLVSYASVTAWIFLWRPLRGLARTCLGALVRPGAALTLSGSILWMAQLSPWPGLVLAVALCPACLLLTGAIGRGDFTLLRSAFAKRSNA